METAESQIKKAADILLSDGIVAMPTETVYGLAARINSKKGIEKIFHIKERPFFDPLIVHISDVCQMNSLTKTYNHPIIKILIEKFWPGPLSIILPKTDKLNPMITAGLDTVAIRMPRHQIALDLISKVGEPLAAPSANKFGKTSPTSSIHVRDSFNNSELYIVEGDSSEIGIESTVIKLNLEIQGKNSIEILRPGFISKSDIEKVLENEVDVRYSNSLSSPGNLEQHYMPEIPLVLVNKILTNDNYTILCKNLKKQNLVISELILDMDGVIAAREVYFKLRKQSKTESDILLFAVKNRDTEIWTAILDRLKRAATFDFRH